MGSQRVQVDPPPEGDHWAARLRRAALQAEASKKRHDADLELRDRLIMEGYDTGHSVGEVAELGLVHKTRVHQIVARLASQTALLQPTNPAGPRPQGD